MEALILAIIITYAIKKAAESSHLHWQGSKAANREASKGRPVRERAASAVRHDGGYWAQQAAQGFPLVRHGLIMGWHSGRIAQLERAVDREKARTGHLEKRASVMAAVREQRRRQAEVLEGIRAAAAASPGPEESAEPAEPAEPEAAPVPRFARRPAGPSSPAQAPSPSPAKGNTMPGDTTYTQQMLELKAIRRDAEEEVNSARRKRMLNRLDVLMSLGLDAATLSEAAAIDDALRAQEKAAQQTLDAADVAISGLAGRHGAIKEAVDSSPVDKPAEPEFYKD